MLENETRSISTSFVPSLAKPRSASIYFRALPRVRRLG
jgi:hypothetical protein